MAADPQDKPLRSFPVAEAIIKVSAPASRAPLPTTVSPGAIIGIDKETRESVAIKDIDRRSGLYVLGISGTGKTELLKRLALTDMQNGHGVFFLDPHGQAIEELIPRIPKQRLGDVICLDPTDEERTFGINLLRCADVTKIQERSAAYTRAYSVFERLWRDEFGVWLELILGNALNVFIENPGYTLADVPQFFEDEAFRWMLVGNVSHNKPSAEYWLTTFAQAREKDQQAKIDALRTRVHILLTREYVRSVVGQTQTTVDFSAIMRERKIVLLRLPTSLPPDDKRFLGTIIVSELLHASRVRPVGVSPQFSIFLDEFQQFATKDSGELITEARKRCITTTIAHQERVGQLRGEKDLLGATAAAGNMVFFQQTTPDAKEFAPKLSDAPPKETHREEQYAINQEPVAALLRAHHNPHIREFVDRYLRVLHEHWEDVKEEMEGVRLERLDDMDESSLHRIDERQAGIYRERAGMEASLNRARDAALQAKGQTGRLLSLFAHGQRLRLTIRGLNRFLTKVMEGTVVAGTDTFSDFLIGLVQYYPGLSEDIRHIFALFITLTYGDAKAAQAIPFAFAKRHGLFAEEVRSLCDQAERQERQERAARKREVWQKEWKKFQHKEAAQRFGFMISAQFVEEVLSRRMASGFDSEWMWSNRPPRICFTPPSIYRNFVWFTCFSSIAHLLSPYLTAKFDGAWESLGRKGIDSVISTILGGCIDGYFGGRRYDPRYDWRFKENIVERLRTFLETYEEGALVTLTLIGAAQNGGWICQTSVDWPEMCDIVNDRMKREGPIYSDEGEDRYYFREEHMYDYLDSKLKNRHSYLAFNMAGFPRIAGVEPIDLLRLVKKLSDIMRMNFKDNALQSYYEPESYRAEFSGKWCQSKIDFYCGWLTFGDKEEYPRFLNGRLPEITARWPVAGAYWQESDTLTRSYLVNRAHDLFSYGKSVADITFPPVAKPGADALVTALVQILEEDEARRAEREYKEREEEERAWIERNCEREVAQITVNPPAVLTPRVLDAAEIQAVKNACKEELKASGEEAQKVAATIDDFAAFCDLLSRPENHIRVRTGQYIERQVNTRAEIDMVNETTRVLTGLDNYTAYAKVFRDIGGESIVWKGRIETLKLSEVSEVEAKKARVVIEGNTERHCRPRQEIEEEIQQRRNQWRRSTMSKPPAARTGTVGGAVSPSDDPDGPPPIRASVQVTAHTGPSGAPRGARAPDTKDKHRKPKGNAREDIMRYKCPKCGKEFSEKTPNGLCDEEKCIGVALVEIAPTVAVVQGLCLLVCDASYSMDEPAFPDQQPTKLEKVTSAVQQALVEMARMTQPKDAFVGLIAFGKRAAFVPDQQGEPFIMSIADIDAHFGDTLGDYLFTCLHSDKAGVDREHTDITAALQLTWETYDDAVSGDFSRIDTRKSVNILKHRDIVTYDKRRIDVPNVRIVLYSDGEHNPDPLSPLVNPFQALDPSPLMTVFIGNESASEKKRQGAKELWDIANVCPVHQQKGRFLVNTPEQYAQLQSLFHMASGASGFCDQCLKEFIESR